MAEYNDREWQYQKGRRFMTTRMGKKNLNPLYIDEDQDTTHYQPGKPTSRDSYRTPSPLPQKNRYAPLSSSYRRDHQAHYETDSDEEDFQGQRVAKKIRHRSPLKTRSSTPSRSREDFIEEEEEAEKDEGEEEEASAQTRQSQNNKNNADYPDQRSPRNTPKASPSHADPTTDPLLKNFEPTDEPMSKKFFIDFMMSFRSAMQNDMGDVKGEMKTLINKVEQTAKQTSTKIAKLEKRLDDMSIAHNNLVDAHKQVMDQNRWLKDKLTDSEDRNRRNNIKIRGVPETVKNEKLVDYVKDVLKTSHPDLKDHELTIDRAHRLPKPPHVPNHLPRDIITRIHYFHAKEKLLSSTRGGQKLPKPFQDLMLFQDLSKETLQARKEFAQITATLRYKHIEYSWGFPTKLLIRDGGTTYATKTPKEALELLAKWKIPILAPRDNRDKPRFQVSISRQLASPRRHITTEAQEIMDTTQPKEQQESTTQVEASSDTQG